MRNIKEIKEIDEVQRQYYMMLSRMESDCRFYLGYGMRDARYALYWKSERKHIQEMLHIYDRIALKPVWLDVAGILRYAERMGVKVRHASWLKAKDRVLRFWQMVLYWKELNGR